jgi:hypothetical protein
MQVSPNLIQSSMGVRRSDVGLVTCPISLEQVTI